MPCGEAEGGVDQRSTAGRPGGLWFVTGRSHAAAGARRSTSQTGHRKARRALLLSYRAMVTRDCWSFFQSASGPPLQNRLGPPSGRALTLGDDDVCDLVNFGMDHPGVRVRSHGRCSVRARLPDRGIDAVDPRRAGVRQYRAYGAADS